jgi:hypothetical protein
VNVSNFFGIGIFYQNNSNEFLFSIDDEFFEIDSFIESILISVGNNISEAYFRMLNEPLSLAYYHLVTFLSVQQKINPNSAQNKMKALGLSEDDFK